MLTPRKIYCYSISHHFLNINYTTFVIIGKEKGNTKLVAHI